MSYSSIDPKTVYLVSGQTEERKLGGRTGLGSVVQQRVVIASDDIAAARVLREQEPSFHPIGMATLADYQKAVHILIATLEGARTEVLMYRAE